MNRFGRRTPIRFGYMDVQQRFYAVGLAELVRHVQAELDAIHNQRLDCGLIATIPFGFYEPSAGYQDTLLDLQPGKMYPVKNVKGVVFPELPFRSTWSFQEEAMVSGYANDLSGLNEPATGSFLSKRVTASEFTSTAQAVDL